MSLPSSTYDTATLVNPGSSLTDFTLIVDLSRMSAAWWAAVDTTDGTKGRAAKDSGPTELACDWIDFDSVNETGLLRVKWSGTLATSGTQTLRIYPPVAANASVSASDTYGSDNAYDSDWAAYWPLATDANDRTANGYDLTAQGGVTVGGVAGKLGAATDFDGSNDRLEDTSATPVDGYPCTYMCWFNSDALGGIPMVSDDTGTNGSIYRRFFNSNFPQAQERDGTTLGEGRTFAVTVSTGTWYMQTGQFISDVSRYGWTNKTKSSQNTTDADSTGCDRFAIGGAIWNGGYFNGKLQHSQIHSAARADDWVKYEYDQVDDQATFWGTWTNTPVAGGISIPVVMHHRRMMGVS